MNSLTTAFIFIYCLSYVAAMHHHFGGGEGLGSFGGGDEGHEHEEHDEKHEEHHFDYYAHPKYHFDYGVKDAHTGDQHAHWEKRDGDKVTGGYSLNEKDGTIRIVEYTADKSGFNAIVKHVGHPHEEVQQHEEHHDVEHEHHHGGGYHF